MRKGLLLLCFMIGLWAEDQNIQPPQEVQESIQESSVQTNEGLQKEEDRSGFVIGLFGGASIMDHSWDYYAKIFEIEGHEQSQMGIAPSYGIKFGYDVYFLKQHGLRVYVDYMASNFLSTSVPSGKVNLHTFALNTEYKYEITDKFGVFAGANLNYTLLDSQFAGSQGGVGFGVNAGFTYFILKWAELELGVRYLGDSLKEKNIPVDSYGQSIGASREIMDFDDLIHVRFGVNFKI